MRERLQAMLSCDMLDRALLLLVHDIRLSALLNYDLALAELLFAMICVFGRAYLRARNEDRHTLEVRVELFEGDTLCLW